MPKEASMRAFKCPSCGAPLEPEIGTLTMKCPYCGGTVIIPESLRTPAQRSGPSMGQVFDWGLSGVDMGQIVGNAMRLPDAIQLAKAGKIEEAADLYSQITGMEHGDAVEAVKNMAAGHAVSLTPGRAGTSWQVMSTSTSQPSVQVTTREPVVFSSSTFSTGPGSTSQKKSGSSCGLLIGILVAVFTLVAVLVGGGYFLFGGGKSLAGSVLPVGFASKVLSFGSEGIGPGQLKDARSVAVDGNGEITVADYQDGRIQTFDANGKFLNGFNISESGKNIYITGMAVGRGGEIYIVHGGKIYVYDKQGNQTNELGDSEHDYNDVSVGGDGKVYAIENNETIVRFKPDMSIDLEVPDTFTNATNDMELDTRVAADGLGNMYVVGSFNYLVLKFSRDGKFLNRFGGQAQDSGSNEPGKFTSPEAIAVDGYGRVYVSDFWDIKVFDSDGAYLNKIDVVGPFGLAVDGQNALYSVTSDKKVVKFNIEKPSGE